jgi:sec-independent protein translocase protein TatA
MPSWIGPWEIVLVVVVVLLVFGPKKLPELGSSLGRSITGFKKGLKDTTDDVKSAIKEDAAAEAKTADTKTDATVTASTVETATKNDASE